MVLRIFIDGVALEIGTDVSFSLIRTNAVFDFDDLVYTRSTSFSLPRTAYNERVLVHSGDIHGKGEYMRQKIRCVITINGVQSVGYIYITSASATEYKCVLYIGEYVDSPFEKTIKQVLDPAQYSDTVFYGNDSLTISAKDSYKDYIAPVAYYSGKEEDGITTAKSKPSVYAKYLLNKVINNNFDDIACRLVTKPEYESDLQGKDIMLFFGNDGSVYYGGHDKDSGDDYFEIVNPYGNTKYLTNVDVSDATSVVETKHVLQYFRAKTDVYLRAKTARAYLYTDLRYIRSYTIGKTTAGIRHIITAQVTEPKWLAGKVNLHTDSSYKPYFYADGAAEDIYIPAGTIFRATRLEDNYPLKGDTSDTLGQVSVLGGRYGGGAFRISPASDRTITTQWDCIPDLKISDFVRSYARIGGLLFYYDGNKLVQIKDDDFAVWGTLSDVVETGEMSRVFEDFAQNTLIQYKDSDKKGVVYYVQNDYLTEETKKTISFSTGDDYTRYENALYIESIGNDVYCGKIGNEYYMTQKQMSKNNIISALCTLSTQLKLRVLMPYYIFNAIPFTALIRYNNAVWVWTEATWQNDICELQLQLYR